MNKVININLNGYVFTVTEEAYEVLKQYIDRLNRHFAGKEGAMEIIADIETRLAELILQRVENASIVIAEEVVREAVKLLGEPWEMDGEDKAEAPKQEPSGKSKGEPKRLMRDGSNKVLGGVCSGIANYFGADPTLVRLIFAAALFLFGSGILLYLILWVAMPVGSFERSEWKGEHKKLFRDPDSRMLGGVCKGLGHFFGLDPVWFRIGFLLAFFFWGTGLLLYAILWVAVPKAQSTADRLRMMGDPVDVTNIERVVNAMPVNAGKAGNFLNEMFGAIIGVIGRVFGLFLLLAGLGILVMSVICFGFGASFSSYHLVKFFIGSNTAYSLGFISGLLTALSLGIIFGFAGMKLLFRLKLRTRNLFIGLIITFFIGLLVSVAAGGTYAFSIKEENEVENEIPLMPFGDTLNIQTFSFDQQAAGRIRFGYTKHHISTLLTSGGDSVFLGNQELHLLPSDNGKAYMKVNVSARGETREQALLCAEQTGYRATQTDSVIWLDPGIFIPVERGFHYQSATVSIYLPAGTLVRLDHRAAMMLTKGNGRWRFRHGTLFRITERGVECVNCPETEDDDFDDEVFNMEIHKDKDNREVNISIRKNDTSDEGEFIVEKEIITTDKHGNKVRTTVRKIGSKETEEVEVISGEKPEAKKKR